MSDVRVLVVDEDLPWREEMLGQYLDALGYDVTRAESLPAVRNLLSLGKRFDVVFTNLHLVPRPPGISQHARADYLGVQVIEHIHKHSPGTPCFIISGQPSELTRRLRDYPEFVEFFHKDELDLDRVANAIRTLDEWKSIVASNYEWLQARLAGKAGGIGPLVGKISADPIQGIQDLIEALAGNSEMTDQCAALGIRLNTLIEIKKEKESVGVLSDTQEHDRRAAIYFAIAVCQEWERRAYR